MGTEVGAREEGVREAVVAPVAHQRVFPVDALAKEVAVREMVTVDLEVAETEVEAGAQGMETGAVEGEGEMTVVAGVSAADRKVFPGDASATEVTEREVVVVGLEMAGTDWAVAETEVEVGARGVKREEAEGGVGVRAAAVVPVAHRKVFPGDALVMEGVDWETVAVDLEVEGESLEVGAMVAVAGAKEEEKGEAVVALLVGAAREAEKVLRTIRHLKLRGNRN